MHHSLSFINSWLRNEAVLEMQLSKKRFFPFPALPNSFSTFWSCLATLPESSSTRTCWRRRRASPWPDAFSPRAFGTASQSRSRTFSESTYTNPTSLWVYVPQIAICSKGSWPQPVQKHVQSRDDKFTPRYLQPGWVISSIARAV